MSVTDKDTAPPPGGAIGPSGELRAARDAPVGGQAVLEGVMMRGIRSWAVAVRKPSEEQLATHRDGLDPEEAAAGEIEIVTESIDSWLRRHRVLRLPIVRGVVALGESLKIGFKALGISANAQLPEEEQEITLCSAPWYSNTRRRSRMREISAM